MNAYESEFERLLVKRLDETTNDKAHVLIFGAAIPDYAAYRECVGYLRALEDMAKFMKEVRDDLNREEKP